MMKKIVLFVIMKEFGLTLGHPIGGLNIGVTATPCSQKAYLFSVSRYNHNM